MLSKAYAQSRPASAALVPVATTCRWWRNDQQKDGNHDANRRHDPQRWAPRHQGKQNRGQRRQCHFANIAREVVNAERCPRANAIERARYDARCNLDIAVAALAFDLADPV